MINDKFIEQSTGFNSGKLRTQISEILRRWGMPTRQVAITEILRLFPLQKELIDSLIQEIKQDPSISISQRNYAIKKMEELAEKI